MNNGTTIPNVYQALAGLDRKVDLRECFRLSLITAAYPAHFADFLVPKGNASAVHLAMMLALTMECRRKLLDSQQLTTFDELIHIASMKWIELNRANKASRVLTDYIKG